MLRRTRLTQARTLDVVAERSEGRFRPSTLGAYERGERSISLRVFCDLAEFYRVPGDQLLVNVMEEINPDGRIEIVVDLNKLVLLEERERRLLSEFIHSVRSRRGDYLSDVITLRSGDVESMALATGLKASTHMGKLDPIISRQPHD